MTTHATLSRPDRLPPAVTATVAAVGSAAVAVPLFAVVATTSYAWVLTVCLAAFAAAVAVVDARTHTLPNRYTSALAAAGLIQAAAVSIASHDGIRFLDSLVAAAVVCSAYVALGLLGWFGFGDAKFAGALAVTVAIYAGFAAMYMVPLAILFAAIWTLLCRTFGRVPPTRPHGPAIALSAVCITTAAVFALPAVV